MPKRIVGCSWWALFLPALFGACAESETANVDTVAQATVPITSHCDESAPKQNKYLQLSCEYSIRCEKVDGDVLKTSSAQRGWRGTLEIKSPPSCEQLTLKDIVNVAEISKNRTDPSAEFWNNCQVAVNQMVTEALTKIEVSYNSEKPQPLPKQVTCKPSDHVANIDGFDNKVKGTFEAIIDLTGISRVQLGVVANRKLPSLAEYRFTCEDSPNAADAPSGFFTPKP